MKELYVIGGQQKKYAFITDEWHRHKKGVIVRVHPESGKSEICVEYVSPPEVCAADDDPSFLFKAGTVQADKLYVCTQTEVLIYVLPCFERIGYLSLPCFNDLHHVQPTPDGNLLIANTGLDMVLEVSPQGKILREWNVLGEDPWGRFSEAIDYRKVATTKPHQSHPNYVFQVGEDIWVTRFEQKDALCLTQPHRRIPIGVERPHDGIVYGESVYFTTIDGYIVVANLKSDKIERIVDLNEITDTDSALGWCRGLSVLDKAHVIVGFTRLRPTKFRENLRWVKHRLSLRQTVGDLPSRIALYDLSACKLCWEQNLEEQGLNAIFSIHKID